MFLRTTITQTLVAAAYPDDDFVREMGREPAQCQLYWHTFVPYIATMSFPTRERPQGDDKRREERTITEKDGNRRRQEGVPNLKNMLTNTVQGIRCRC